MVFQPNLPQFYILYLSRYVRYIIQLTSLQVSFKLRYRPLITFAFKNSKFGRQYQIQQYGSISLIIKKKNSKTIIHYLKRLLAH